MPDNYVACAVGVRETMKVLKEFLSARTGGMSNDFATWLSLSARALRESNGPFADTTVVRAVMRSTDALAECVLSTAPASQ